MNPQLVFGESKIFHGCDYNPEQWLDYPEILEKDLALMQEAGCNIVSIGIFSWAKLEPEEGKFDFSWLDMIIEKLHAHGVKVILATPSGARPAWLDLKYPEVLRMTEDRQTRLHGHRQNHCLTSPVYREKVKIINTKLAERYAHHPAVVSWHISNEFGGYCHCPLCQKAFRRFLKERYGTLEKLNHAWWSTFWSHTYTDWDQIESPSKNLGEWCVHGLNLDFRRFSTAQCMDFCKAEIDTVKPFNPDLPVTTNFMEFFYDYDYFEFAKILDYTCWDSYPEWHVYEDPEYIASYTAMNHDLMRSLKQKPFVLMEHTVSCTNWRPLSRLKKPGMEKLSCLQAVAHGADSIQGFQWRKSRGSSEKFHGAIIDHVGHLNTRVGREVVELGGILQRLGEVAGTEVRAQAALVLDTQNRWALDDAQGPRNAGLHYLEVCLDYYHELWRRGVAVDVIDETCPLDKYKLVIAPMTYMIRSDYGQRVESFVKNGGVYVSTFWSGIVDENDLCFLGGFPGPLRQVLGIWDEEIECLDEGEQVKVISDTALSPELWGSYQGSLLCALVHPESAQTLAQYDSDFYRGMSAVTRNIYGMGRAYYVATRLDKSFLDNFVRILVDGLDLTRELSHPIAGVSAMARYSDTKKFLFIGNYSAEAKTVGLKGEYYDLVNEQTRTGNLTLMPYGSAVLSCPL